RGVREATVMADSIRTFVQKTMIDSIVKANMPAMIAMGSASANAAVRGMGVMVPPAPWGKRRIVIANPRESRRAEINVMSSLLVDSLRRALSGRGGYLLVDQDSVREVLKKSRDMSVLRSALKPDIVISSAFLGTGDSLTVMFTMRDLSDQTRVGVRMPTSPVRLGDPGSLSPGIKLVLKNLDDLARAPKKVQVFQTVPRPVPNTRLQER
ncbi:MAG TPA: hypothetical protein VM939_13340, partial [Gemmatimonadaceae bacterium]|nr:hypothetical protein [Gemmatimonadaceae bacterium]